MQNWEGGEDCEIKGARGLRDQIFALGGKDQFLFAGFLS